MSIEFPGMPPIRGASGPQTRTESVRNIQPIYGSESDLQRLGASYVSQVDEFMDSRALDSTTAANVRSRIIGALTELDSAGLLTQRVRISITRDPRKPDGIAVMVGTDQSSGLRTEQTGSRSRASVETEEWHDDPSWVGFGYPLHRPPWWVEGDPRAPLDDTVAESEDEGDGIREVSSSGGSGLSGDSQRNRQQRQNPEREEDSGNDDRKSLKQAIGDFGRWLFGG